MTADVVWPEAVLKATAGKSKVTATTIGGGRSLSGLEQVVANDAGFWRLTMANISVRSNAHVEVWNAIEVQLQGRSGTVVVPMLDCMRSPWPTVDGKLLASYGDIPFSDDALFSDGVGFYQPVIVADASSGIAERATSGTIRISYGGTLAAGMHFSVGERGYRIQRVLSTTDLGGGVASYTITFWPPAREAIEAGTALNLDCPHFRARLASDGEMDFDPELFKFGRPTLNFVEDV